MTNQFKIGSRVRYLDDAGPTEWVGTVVGFYQDRLHLYEVEWDTKTRFPHRVQAEYDLALERE